LHVNTSVKPAYDLKGRTLEKNENVHELACATKRRRQNGGTVVPFQNITLSLPKYFIIVLT